MPSPFKWLDASFGRKALAAIVEHHPPVIVGPGGDRSHKRGTRDQLHVHPGTATGATNEDELDDLLTYTAEDDAEDAEEGDFEFVWRP